MNLKTKAIALTLFSLFAVNSRAEFKTFPDGSAVPAWFNNAEIPQIDKLGKKYVVTCGVLKNIDGSEGLRL